MGLDAHVACNCFSDELCTEPPVPRNMLTLDECGDVMLIDEDNSDFDQICAVLDWKEHACEHEYMQIAGEWIGNVSGVAWLRSLAAGLPGERFENLVAILSGLSGMMDSFSPASDVRRALPELEELLREDHAGSTRTIAELSGSPVENELDRGPIQFDEFHSLGPSPYYASPWPDLVELGIVRYEFVVRNRENPPSELLRARILQQKWNSESVEHASTWGNKPTSRMTFTNLQTGESVTARSFGISTRPRPPDESPRKADADESEVSLRYPETLIVGERKRMVTEAWWMLNNIHRLFEASVATGNPVAWH